MENELIRSVAIIVGRHNTLQLERNLIANIIVSGILQVGSLAGGVVGVLNLLFRSRGAGLGTDDRGANDLDHKQAVSLPIAHRALVLDQIIAGGNGQRSVFVHGSNSSGLQIYIILDRSQLLCIAFAIHSSQRIKRSLINRSSFLAFTVFTPLHIRQNAIMQIAGKNLVNIISTGAVRRSGNRSVSRSRKRGDGQGQGHDQCQQNAGHTFHGFHSSLFSFLCLVFSLTWGRLRLARQEVDTLSSLLRRMSLYSRQTAPPISSAPANVYSPVPVPPVCGSS